MVKRGKHGILAAAAKLCSVLRDAGLRNQLRGPFNGKFDYIVLICPTFAYNRTLHRFGERDPRLYVIICEQHYVETWLKAASFAFEGTNTLIVLDDCAASKGGPES